MGTFKRCTGRAEFEAIEAKFYDSGDAERLSYGTVADYLDSIMQDMEIGTSDEDAEAALIAMAPLAVWAYLPELHDPAERARWVRDRVESFEESVSERHHEDLGDPDEDAPVFTPAERAEVEAFVGRWLDRVGAWRCDAVAVYDYSAEDIRAVLGRSA